MCRNMTLIPCSCCSVGATAEEAGGAVPSWAPQQGLPSPLSLLHVGQTVVPGGTKAAPVRAPPFSVCVEAVVYVGGVFSKPGAMQGPGPAASHGPHALGSSLSSGCTASVSQINRAITSCCPVACDKGLASGDGARSTLVVVTAGHGGHVSGHRLTDSTLGCHPRSVCRKEVLRGRGLAGLPHEKVQRSVRSKHSSLQGIYLQNPCRSFSW